MSKQINGFIAWLRTWFDDIYQLKGSGGITIEEVYPIGAIYMTVDNYNPNTLFTGTTWVRLKDTFLYAHPTGISQIKSTATDGSADAVVVKHTHTQNEHNHTQNSHNHTQNAHGHGMAHNHNHRHTMAGKWSSGSGSKTAYMTTNNRSQTDTYTSYDATGSSKNTTDDATATNNDTTATNNATTATNQETGVDGTGKNMPPYLPVNMWKRIA